MTLKKNRLLQRIKQSDKGIDSMKCSIIFEWRLYVSRDV